ncbi:MAG: hypothetical protein K1X36_09550 [Pyrinomonadaceae bacterium]|nr:hypothetical protein [Pyrinomonadaceae bacterium]
MKQSLQKATLFLSVLAIIGFSAVESSAQTKKRIGLPEGANSVEVKGSISGKRFALYEIWADKGDVWEVDLDSGNEYIGYTVKAPNGDRYDFLEPSPTEGYYLIRVELNSTGSRSKKPAAFTLKINFEMEPGRPIS